MDVSFYIPECSELIFGRPLAISAKIGPGSVWLPPLVALVRELDFGLLNLIRNVCRVYA